MPTPEERLAIVLEATDKATAILQKVRKEIEVTNDATSKGGKGANEAGDSFHKLGESSPRIRQLGREMSGVAFAINEARLGSKGAVLEVASLAGTAAETSVAFAAWAPLIGGAVALLGTALAIAQDHKREEEQLANFRDHVQGKSLEYTRQIVQETRNAKERTLKLIDESQVSLLQKAVGYVDLLTGHVSTSSVLTAAQAGSVDELEQQAKEEELATKALVEKERAERIRLLTLHDQTTELARQRATANATAREQLELVRERASTLDVELAGAKASLETQNQSVVAMFRRRDESGKIVALTAQEVADRGRLLGLNRQAYQLAVATAQERAAQRVIDARFDIQARTAAVVMETQLQRAQKTTIDQQRLAADTAYQKESDANKRSGLAAADRERQEERIFALYQAQIALIDAIAERTQRMAHADRLANSSDVTERFRGRMEQIEEEKKAQVSAGVSKAEAEATAAQKQRQLKSQLFHEELANLKTIEDATLSSHNRTVRAVGLAANTLRRLQIGAEASLALVESARAFAKVPGYLASGAIGSAALSAASGVQLAAAAALGFRESLGGGGGGAAGGGSASGAGTTFQPTGNTGTSQPLTINLYTLHGSDPTLVQSIAYELQKGELLKRPALATPPAVNLGASVGRAA